MVSSREKQQQKKKKKKKKMQQQRMSPNLKLTASEQLGPDLGDSAQHWRLFSCNRWPKGSSFGRNSILVWTNKISAIEARPVRSFGWQNLQTAQTRVRNFRLHALLCILLLLLLLSELAHSSGANSQTLTPQTAPKTATTTTTKLSAGSQQQYQLLVAIESRIGLQRHSLFKPQTVCVNRSLVEGNAGDGSNDLLVVEVMRLSLEEAKRKRERERDWNEEEEKEFEKEEIKAGYEFGFGEKKQALAKSNRKLSNGISSFYLDSLIPVKQIHRKHLQSGSLELNQRLLAGQEKEERILSDCKSNCSHQQSYQANLVPKIGLISGNSGAIIKRNQRRAIATAAGASEFRDNTEISDDLLELLAQFYAHQRELEDTLQIELVKELNNERVKVDQNGGKNIGEQRLRGEGKGKGEGEKEEEEEKEKNGHDERRGVHDKEVKFRLKMKLEADLEGLQRWLQQRQQNFSSLKDAKIQVISEHPNKTINVCLDGPKILVLPNVSDVIYCYTREQWIEKLWLDLRLSTFHYPIILLNVLIFLFGTTGNIFVCLSVYRNHQLRNVTNYFIVNLAFADLLVILICLPVTVVWDLSLTWFFGTIPCKLIMYLQDVSISVSVLTLTAISIDRYYAICHPLRFKSNLSQAKRVIVAIWCLSILIMMPDLIYLSAKESADLSEAGLNTVLYSDCNYNWSEHSSRVFQFVKTILLYLIPFILMLCAHFKIMQTLRVASSQQSAFSERCQSAGYKLQPLGATSGATEGPKLEQRQRSFERPARESSRRHLPVNPGESTGPIAGGQAKQVSGWPGKKVEGLASCENESAKRAQLSQQNSQNFRQIRFAQQSSIQIERLQSNSSDRNCQSDGSKSFESAQTIGDGSADTIVEVIAANGSSSARDLAKQEQLVAVENGTPLGEHFCSRNSVTGSGQLLSVTMHNKSKLESRRSAAKMLMAIVVLFGICYFPVHLINFLRQFIEDIPQTDVTSTISMLSHCVCYLNSAINPIIYNHMNSIFRAEFEKFLFYFCRKRRRRQKAEAEQRCRKQSGRIGGAKQVAVSSNNNNNNNYIFNANTNSSLNNSLADTDQVGGQVEQRANCSTSNHRPPLAGNNCYSNYLADNCATTTTIDMEDEV